MLIQSFFQLAELCLVRSKSLMIISWRSMDIYLTRQKKSDV